MAYDLVIRDGTLLDGSGSARYRADLGVVGGRIVTIGRIRERGAEEVDAAGRFVAPGFIDGHTHMDAQINWDPLGTSSCWHGVTSVIMGNCGFTLAPCAESDKDLVFRSLERAEDISREAMLAGIRWDWETFPEYLDAVDRLPKGINYAAYLGHSALRTYVMGERAFEEEAGEKDLVEMRRAVEAAMRAGAVGFSTSRSLSHMTSDDRPVASRLASWDEVRALVGVMGELGSGLFELDHEKHPPGEGREDYLRRVRELAVESGRPVFFMLVIPPTEPDLATERLAYLDAAALEGGRIYAQVHSHEAYIVMSFRTQLPFDRLPGWAALRSRSIEEQRRALTDPVQRARLVEEAMTSEYRVTVGAEPRPPDYDWIVTFDSPTARNPSIAELARARGTTPVDTMIDLALESDFNQLFGQMILNRDLDTVLRIMRHPRTVVGVSDSGAHVSQLSDGSIPTHLLAYWVRERGELTWEEAVRMLTSVPANLYGFSDRGYLREGFAADLVVFDPDTVAPARTVLTNDLPTGARRLRQMATGIGATVVNGQVVLRDGEHTGALPGRLLRGSLARSGNGGS